MGENLDSERIDGRAAGGVLTINLDALQHNYRLLRAGAEPAGAPLPLSRQMPTGHWRRTGSPCPIRSRLPSVFCSPADRGFPAQALSAG